MILTTEQRGAITYAIEDLSGGCYPLTRNVEIDDCNAGCGAPAGQECDDGCSRVKRLAVVTTLQGMVGVTP